MSSAFPGAAAITATALSPTRLRSAMRPLLAPVQIGPAGRMSQNGTRADAKWHLTPDFLLLWSFKVGLDSGVIMAILWSIGLLCWDGLGGVR
jgi:hypothetical protein